MTTIASFIGANRWLSNFWPCEVVLDGVTYPSVENAYQAAKTLDPELRALIRGMTSSGAKGAGKRLKLRSDWWAVKLDVMEALLRQKFAVPEFQAKLLATGDCEIIEGNTWGDTFWGVCRGKGTNHLGRLIMQIRQELQQAATATATPASEQEEAVLYACDPEVFDVLRSINQRLFDDVSLSADARRDLANKMHLFMGRFEPLHEKDLRV